MEVDTNKGGGIVNKEECAILDNAEDHDVNIEDNDSLDVLSLSYDTMSSYDVDTSDDSDLEVEAFNCGMYLMLYLQ